MQPPPPSFSIPTTDDVKRITAVEDPLIRNLQITQCYHEISEAVSRRTGLRANWCTFAAWASKQAGQTIRKEDLKRTLEDILDVRPEAAQEFEALVAALIRFGARPEVEEIRLAVRELIDLPAIAERSSASVAAGNLKVFAEIGYEFARFLADFPQDAGFDPDYIEEFCEKLLPGDPPDGQGYLRKAFSHYYRAFFEQDLKTSTELLLLANLEIGFHEQTRLQPEIAAALDAALIDPDQFVRQLLASFFPYGGWFAMLRNFLRSILGGRTPLEIAADAFLAELRLKAHRVITEHLMTIELSHGNLLHLGADLSSGFPPSLQHIANPELLSLLAKIDPTPDSTHSSGALDWADLTERIHFIADMFRCYQESPELFQPPFSSDQVIALKGGMLPQGRL